MTTNDPITAALQQLAEQHEQITQLDTREAGHYTALSDRLTELTDLVTGIGHTLQDDAAVLARIAALDQQITDLAAQLAPYGADPGQYRPDPAPTWWKLAAAERREPLPGCGPGSSRSTNPDTATWPQPSAPAGPPTTCACTVWTSPPACGRRSTSSPAAAPGCCPPRPNTRPASCPPWPPSS